MAAATPSKGSRSTTSANRRSSRNSTQATSPHALKKPVKKRASAAADAETDDDDEEADGAEEPEKIEKARNGRGKGKAQGKITKSKYYDSDALDEDSDFDANEDEEEEEKPQKSKRKRTSGAGKQSKTPSLRKRRRKAGDEDADEEEDDFELKEGQEIVGEVVQAPKTGRVPPGQISKNTLDFLEHLSDPKCNDREWFKLHEPVYRLAEKEFKDFVDAFTEVLTEVDPHVPPLPPKDVIHRIYRDVRFSNDKTPYKRNMSASFSRSGRKGIFACYHVSIKPGGESLLAAGTWCPGKNELATIRSNIAHSPDQLRQVISDPAFVALFGEPKPVKGGGRRNIFGADDELKVAPKGFDKDHKDIDLLKCRTFAVVHRFKDSEVLAPDFKTKLGEVAAVVRPFVRCLNDLMTIQTRDNDDGNGDDDV